MKDFIHRHKIFWLQKPLRISAIYSVILLILSFVVNYYANVYTNLRASNYVSDLFLDNLPVVNVDWVFFEGFVIFWIFVIFILIKDPHRLPFAVKSIALFVIVRSMFMILTHIAEPPNHSILDTNWFFSLMTTGNDLFFSSHTGLPFLMALNFWKNKKIRVFFILATIIFASSVLLGHLHYSIDVFSALFITYGIFRISQIIFPNDYKLLLEESAEK